jgi:hypothetical protein
VIQHFRKGLRDRAVQFCTLAAFSFAVLLAALVLGLCNCPCMP